ncbi:MAG: ABC transporter permease subunit [Angustibacter sp.]
MSTATSTTSGPTNAGLGTAARAATGRAHPLRSELGRLRHRRLVLLVVGLGFLALVAAMVIVFLTHSTDLAGARQKATVAAQQATADQARYRQECLADPNIPQADKDAGACGSEDDAAPTAQDLYQDPRLRADVGLPAIAIGVAVGGALVAALVGATGVGADWSSRTIITLLTWEPRRIRLLARRHLAIALAVAAIGVVGQVVGLGLGALVVAARGTWDHTVAGSAAVGYQTPAIVPAGHFWRDLVSLQVRGVGLMVVVAVLAAALTTVTRHTGGTLGIAFAWFAVVENAVRIVFSDRGWPRWLVTENVVAFLAPGGQRMMVASPASGSGSSMGPDEGGRTVLVSNLDALLYLGVLTAAALLLAGVLLRRRDL